MAFDEQSQNTLGDAVRALQTPVTGSGGQLSSVDINKLNSFMLMSGYLESAAKNENWVSLNNGQQRYKNLLLATGNGTQKTLDIVNSFIAPTGDLTEAASSLTTKELSSLYTHVILYKTQATKDRIPDWASKKQVYLLNSYTSKESIINSITNNPTADFQGSTNNKQSKMDSGAGIKDLKISLTSDTGAYYQYNVSLSIFVQNLLQINHNEDLQDLLNLNMTRPLFLLEFGWADSSQTNLATKNLNTFTNKRTTLVLNLTTYELKIEQNGSCTINCNFVGGTEDVYRVPRTSNCLYDEVEEAKFIQSNQKIEEDKEKRQKKANELNETWRKGPADKAERLIKETNDRLQIDLAKYAEEQKKTYRSLYSQFLNKLPVRACMNTIESNTFRNEYNNYTVRTLGTEQILSNINEQEKKTPDLTSNDIPDFNLWSKISGESVASDNATKYQCNFVMLGDILDVAFTNFSKNSYKNSPSEPISPIVLSTMDLRYKDNTLQNTDNDLSPELKSTVNAAQVFYDVSSATRESQKYPLHSFPIPYHFFLSWYSANILDSSNLQAGAIIRYPMHLFMNKIMNLVTTMIKNYNSHRRELIQYFHNLPDKALVENFKLKYPKSLSLSSNDINFKITHMDTLSDSVAIHTMVPDWNWWISDPHVFGDYTRTNELTNNIILIYGDFTDIFRNGKYDDNLAAGIYHFFINSETGIIKTYSFNPIKDTAQQASAISSATADFLSGNKSSFAIFRYELQIKTFGNSLFRPGQIIYVDTTLTGMGKSNEPTSMSSRFNIGGYYMIIKVDHSLASNNFETGFSAKFIGSGVPQD